MWKNLFKSKKKKTIIRTLAYENARLKSQRDYYIGKCTQLSHENDKLRKYYKDSSSELSDYELLYSHTRDILKDVACEWKPAEENNEDYTLFHTACGHTYLHKFSDGAHEFTGLDKGTTSARCPYCGKGVCINQGEITNVDSNEEQSETETE